MSGDKKVVSYGDVVLWSSDVALLGGNHFLNDRLIDFFFAQLDVPDDVLLLSPAIGFWISHCSDTESLLSSIESLSLPKRQVVVFAINDNEDVNAVGSGRHWSLLVYTRKLNRFEHYDSMGGMNVGHAKKFAAVIKKHMGPDSASATFEECWTPCQENGYDCGVYVMAVAQVLCKAYANGLVGSAKCRALVEEKVTPSTVSEMRKSVRKDIQFLAESQQR